MFLLVKMFLVVRILLFGLLIISVKSKCTTSYITYCESLSDVQRLGLKTWENLAVSADLCNQAKVDTLDEVLKPNFFGNAKNIEELYIVDKINGIEANSFGGLTQLTYIKLHKNQIKVIPTLAFSNLNLIKADLQHNSIETLESGIFHKSTVKYINLSHNKLTNIQHDRVNLPSLSRLVATHNVITYVGIGSLHENLEYLNLDHNNIAQFEKAVLEPLVNLKELILSYNRFQGIDMNYGLPSLETLDLSYNSIVGIQDGTFQGFLKLKTLKLNHNLITHVSHKIFPNGNDIRLLHLHYNAIIQIFEPVGKILEKLEEITVSGNPWSCACLKNLANYLEERQINQPDCDRRYFTLGKSAVCVVGEETCSGDEELTKESFENFSKSISADLCSDLD